MRLGARLERHGAEWAASLDEPLLRSANSPRSVLAVGGFMAVFVWAGASPDLFGSVLEAQPLPFFVAVAPAWAASLFLSFYQRSRRGPPRIAAIAIGSILLVAYEAGCLVSFHSARAAPALAGLVALTCVAHGHQGRASARHPYVALADLAGIALAALWAPSGAHRAFLAIGGVSGVVAGLVVGTSAFESYRARARADALRNAVHAQVAAERFAKATELEGLRLDVGARNHDVNNALMVVLLKLEMLFEELDARSDPLADEADRAVVSLRTALDILSANAGRAGLRAQPVAIAATLDSVVEAVSSRYPGVAISTTGVGATLIASVDDGPVGVRRIFENVLLNAAEGDGRTGARRVEVRAEREPDSQMVLIEVADDGPGFQPAQLRGEVEAFGTTKPTGSGLGLFTADRLARASGGWIARRNRPGGGALVSIVLPLGTADGERT